MKYTIICIKTLGAILEDERPDRPCPRARTFSFQHHRAFPRRRETFLRGSGLQSFEAHTGLDETRYAVHDVPVNDPKLNEKMLLLLRDWCHGIKILPKDVDKERGIVIEEWRQRNDINHRLSDAIAPAIYNKDQICRSERYRNRGDSAVFQSSRRTPIL